MPDAAIVAGVAGIGARQVRVEDEALVTGRATYTGDLVVDGHDPRRVRPLAVRPRAHHRDRRDRGARRRRRRRRPDRRRPAPRAGLLPGVPRALRRRLPPPAARPRHRSLRRRDRRHRHRRIPGHRQSMRPSLSSSTTTRCPPSSMPVEAASHDAPLLFPATGTNVAVDLPFEAGERRAGDSVVVRATITNQRMAVAPMEGNAITAVPDAESRRITAYVSTQMPHALRDLSAMFLGMDASRAPDRHAGRRRRLRRQDAGRSGLRRHHRRRPAPGPTGAMGAEPQREPDHNAGSRPPLRRRAAGDADGRHQQRGGRRRHRRRRLPRYRLRDDHDHPIAGDRALRHPPPALRHPLRRHQHGAGRCVPRRGTAGGGRHARASDGHPRRRARHGSRCAAAAEPHSSGTVPLPEA